jgi:hypothetical protein
MTAKTRYACWIIAYMGLALLLVSHHVHPAPTEASWRCRVRRRQTLDGNRAGRLRSNPAWVRTRDAGIY